MKRKIVENIEALARSFSSEIVCKGSSQQKRPRLSALGIRFGQGFYYSRPATIDMLMSKYA